MKIKLFLLLFSLSTSLFGQFKESIHRNSEVDFQNQKISITSSEKSKTLAFFLSLVLPGAGEYYVNRFEQGKYFFIAEGALWLTLWGFDHYGQIMKDNYINYANTNGGVNPTGKDKRYWAVIGSYMNIYDYNNEKLLNREFQSLFDENLYYWNWNTNQDRKKYRNIWLSSESALNNKQFPIALIVINHLVSAINAAILANNYNENLKNESLQIIPKFGVDNFLNPKIYLTFQKSF